MSGHGAPAPQQIDAAGLRVVVVAGQWHDGITDGLIAGAERVLEASGADWRLVRVPGSFELPVAAKAALDAGADAVVALGVIIRGGTPHFEFVSSAATDGLTRGMKVIDTGAPISVPVGDLTKGRIFNVLGEPVDQNGIGHAEGWWRQGSDPRRWRCAIPPRRCAAR